MASIMKSALMVASAGASTPAGSFAVTEGSYQLGGFLCGQQESKASIWYPTELSKGPFPIVTYGHGMGGQMIPDLIESVASLGIVVVAPATSGGKCDDNHWKDMLHAIEGSKSNPSLHQALQHVDWERVGIMGHSMGGYASLNGAVDVTTNPSKYSFTLKAMLDSHGYIGDIPSAASQITMPAFFSTGSEDHASRLKGAFDTVGSKSKVLAEVQGADHMYPAENGALNPFDAHFLGCHVADLQTSCNKIYGTGQDTICKANTMTLCQVEGGAPSPSPSPPPSTQPCGLSASVPCFLQARWVGSVHPTTGDCVKCFLGFLGRSTDSITFLEILLQCVWIWQIKIPSTLWTCRWELQLRQLLLLLTQGADHL